MKRVQKVFTVQKIVQKDVPSQHELSKNDFKLL